MKLSEVVQKMIPEDEDAEKLIAEGGVSVAKVAVRDFELTTGKYQILVKGVRQAIHVTVTSVVTTDTIEGTTT